MLHRQLRTIQGVTFLVVFSWYYPSNLYVFISIIIISKHYNVIISDNINININPKEGGIFELSMIMLRIWKDITENNPQKNSKRNIISSKSKLFHH